MSAFNSWFALPLASSAPGPTAEVRVLLAATTVLGRFRFRASLLSGVSPQGPRARKISSVAAAALQLMQQNLQAKCPGCRQPKSSIYPPQHLQQIRSVSCMKL